MKLKFQYNKISIKNLEKQLKMRQNALPILKSKEAALRLQVQNLKKEYSVFEEKYISKKNDIYQYSELWNEFDFSIIGVDRVETEIIKIAGVSIHKVSKIIFNEPEILLTAYPIWFVKGINDLKELLEISVNMEFIKENMLVLEYTRRKTTQKVNLYEKVQIPEYQIAISKIKSYLENEEHIALSAQKILKNKLWNLFDE